MTMTSDTQTDRPFAVVTGASSGIGLQLSDVLVQHGYDVLMCAEDAAVHEAAADLEADGSHVEAVQADLATPKGTQKLVDAATADGRVPDVLALNAGIGNWGPFIESSLSDDLKLLQLNVISPVTTAKQIVPQMVERGSGRVLITASVGSRTPEPFQATYAASKAFDHSFAEALRHELKETGVTVTSLEPGPTDTEFFTRAHVPSDSRLAQAPKDAPRQVAEQAFTALMAGKDHVVTGSLLTRAVNRAQTVAAGLVPEPLKAAAQSFQGKPQQESGSDI